MRGAFVALTIGGVLVYSGLKGLSILDVLAGRTGSPLDPRGGQPRVRRGSPDYQGTGPTTGTPQAIIEHTVIPMARKHGINVTVESVRAANARHSTRTLTGGRSDHSGPGHKRWAIDAAGSKAAMAALAAELADVFGIEWNGAGAKSETQGPLRFQLIYRTMIGGNHFTHVHFGIENQEVAG
jgi:hypothetical protein